MCGIIGIVTKQKRNIIPDIIGALSRLEYRGYDSAGISFVKPVQGRDMGVEINSPDYKSENYIYKCLGAPSINMHASDIYEKLQISSPEVHIGIGHNRWATHGMPSIINAHPHTDINFEVSVVHNGTILNYEILKKDLEDKNVKFNSDTDTEVIPQMIAFYIRSGMDMRRAFETTINRLEGGFGILAYHKDNDKVLYIAKQGSPIVIGLTKDSYYVSSSLHGFLPFTDK